MISYNNIVNSEKLLWWLRNDSIGRNSDIIEFIKLLEKIDGKYTFFLDAKWGEGKTVFIRQLEMVLKSYNENIDYNVIDDINILKDSPSPSKQWFPIYFNAWEHDDFKDPLAAIVFAISSSTNCKFKKDIKFGAADAVTKTFDEVLKLLGFPQVLNNIMGNITNTSYLNEYENYTKLQDKIDAFISAVVKKVNGHIVLFVDELDRCSPAFSLRLLEVLKNKFATSEIVIVYSVNSHELSKTIEKEYGFGINGYEYLQKFYDQRFSLSQIGAGKYADQCNLFPSSSALIYTYAIEFSDANSLSLRACNMYFEVIEKIDKLECSPFCDQRLFAYLKILFVPVLLGIKILNEDDFKKIKDSFDSSLFYNYIANCNKIKAKIDEYAKNFTQDDCKLSSSFAKDKTELALGLLLSRKTSSKHEEVANMIGSTYGSVGDTTCFDRFF